MQDLASLPKKDLEIPTSELRAIAELALAEAARLGASAAEVAVNRDNGLEVNVRQGEVESIEHQADRGFGITVYLGQSRANASSADFSEAGIKATVAAAASRARFTAADEFSGLADPALLATEFPDLDSWHPWGLAPEDAIGLAQRCEAAAFAADERISNSDGATVNSGAGVRVYANSNGFCGATAGTSHSLSCSIIAGSGDEMQRDYWYDYSRKPQALDTPENIGVEASRRCLARLGGRQVATADVPVLFAPDISRSLVSSFLRAISGASQYRRSSFLLDCVGETIFSPHIQLREQPHLRGALASIAFDQEGVATQDRDWVVDGVVQEYLMSSYSARKLGRQTTGNAGGVHNLLVQSKGNTAVSQADLIAEMGTGLLVTEMMGQGVNPVTGDYSRGAAGLWIENGEIAYPVEEVTVAGNLRDAFKSIRAIADDVDQRGNIQCGSMLVDGFTVAGG